MKAHNTGLIQKVETKSNFTVLTNEICQSKTLTPTSKAIIIYLLSLPSDWSIVKMRMHKEINIGRDAFNKGWKQLIELGYIVSTKHFDAKNKTNHYSYRVTGFQSTDNNITDNRVTEFQSTDKIFTSVENTTSENTTSEISTSVENTTSEITPEQLPVEELPTEINNTIEKLNEEMKEFEEEEEEQPEEIENNNTERPIEKFNNFLNSQKIIDIAMYAVNDNFSLNEIQSILSDRYSINTKMKKDVVLNNLFGILTSKQMKTDYKFNNR